jgi:OmpA-OmpF porin, OOP family
MRVFMVIATVKLNLFLLAIMLCCLPTNAQELLNNNSFEQKSYCPGNFNQQTLTTVAGWWQPSDGTPDYFNECSNKVGVPNNVFGSQLAKEGAGYVGMVIYSSGSNRNYREYIQSQLSRPLMAGEMVCIEFYISAADYCAYVCDGFGVALTSDRIEHKKMGVIDAQPVIANPQFNMLDYCEGWMLVSDVYTAVGGEQYITLGNFKFDKELKIIKRTEDLGAKAQDTWAYVYIDQVSVKPVKQRNDCSCENDILKSQAVDPPLELKEYDRIALDAILFDFDQDVLTDSARIQIKGVYDLLRKNRAMYMEISGYTDIKGSEEYNMGLSKRRAQRVIDELIALGIDKERLNMSYFGKELPVADNTTDEGRMRNRRVEFQILKRKFELIQ